MLDESRRQRERTHEGKTGMMPKELTGAEKHFAGRQSKAKGRKVRGADDAEAANSTMQMNPDAHVGRMDRCENVHVEEEEEGHRWDGAATDSGDRRAQ